MFNIKRPKPTDTEEDLLAEEQQFLASKEKLGQGNIFKPAAQVIKVKRESDVLEAPAPVTGKTASNKKTNIYQKPPDDVLDVGLIGGIKEKNVTVSQLGSLVPNVLDFDWMKKSIQQNKKVEEINERKKSGSLFKQERMNRQHTEVEAVTPLVEIDAWAKVQENYDQFNPLKDDKSMDLKNATSIGVKEVLAYPNPESSSTSSTVEIDSSVGENIHPLLAGYSEADILEAQRELLKIMKPETKQFLLARKANNTNKNEEQIQEPRPGDALAGNVRDISLEDFPIHPDKVKLFPHMDQMEKEKLEWTLPVQKTEKKQHIPDQNSGGDVPTRAARFDFKGQLLTEEMEKDEETWNRALHNHEEEMDRPGYTIEELFTLARSQLGPQRALAFNTLAEIFNRSHNGELDLCLEKSLLHVCNEMDFVHVLRVGMDNSDALTMNAAINCLSALLYPAKEELCLDCCYHWPNAVPYQWISTKAVNEEISDLPVTGNPNEDVDESELKDHQIVRADLIEFLIHRTDILTRFNYLLRNKETPLNENGVLGILKIVIRIARHSPNKLIECHDLLGIISAYFMTSNWTMIGKRPSDMVGVPLPLAVKIFRVLVNSGRENAHKVYKKMDLFPPLMSYLAYDQWLDQNHVMEVEFLILESFKLWDAFLTYGLGVQEYSSFFPILMNFLHLLRTRDTLCSFDLNHATHLFTLMEKIIRIDSHSHWGLIKDGASFVAAFVIKLLAILRCRNTAKLYDHDLSLAALSKGLQFISLSRPYERFPGVDLAVRNFVESSEYSEITSHLLSHSLLLSKLGDSEKEMNKYPSNLSPCTSILYGGWQTPIMNQGTPFSFLTVLLRFVRNHCELTAKLETFILDTHVQKYTKRISTSSCPPRNNIFLRFELYCVAELVKFLSPSQQLTLSYKLIPQIQNGDHRLAEEFLGVFIRGSGYPSSEETLQLYTHFLINGSKGENLDSTNFQYLNMKLLPYDWIVEPLNLLHKRALFLEKEKLDSEKRLKVLQSLKECTELTLKFLQFCLAEQGSVLVKNVTHIAAIYSRIVLVFMMGNGLFLEKEIQISLKHLAKLLISNSALEKAKGQVFTNFNKMPGFPPEFCTFYGELLTEFGENSFGDEVFAAYLLMPLRTADDHNIKSRFWNDESIRYIRTNPETSIVPLQYFTPRETDAVVTQIYRNTLMSPRVNLERNPLLYNILKFHVTK